MTPEEQAAQDAQAAPPAPPAPPMTVSELTAAMKATLLAQAIEAHPVAKLGVGQLVQLWGDEFKVGKDQFGRLELQNVLGEPAADTIKYRFTTPEYAHFIQRPGAPVPTTPTADQQQAELVRRARAAAGLPNPGGPNGDYVPLGRR
jgi:hypothetical protein